MGEIKTYGTLSFRDKTGNVVHSVPIEAEMKETAKYNDGCFRRMGEEVSEKIVKVRKRAEEFQKGQVKANTSETEIVYDKLTGMYLPNMHVRSRKEK